MDALARRLIPYLPRAPRKRYCVFAGTNSAAEWGSVLRYLSSGASCEESDVIADYERRFAQGCGARHGISFGAGRMALYSILEALGIGEGDEVIIPAFTCVVVPNAIIYRGARPIYVDIEARRFNIDANKVEAAITPRTKALYAQHTFGVPCDVESLRDIGRRHGLPVIEDAAHALGALWRGKAAGSLTEVSFFSTDHSKVINTHLGGMAVTNDDDLAARLRRAQARAPFLSRTSIRRLLQSFLVEYACYAPGCFWFGRTAHAVLLHAGVLFFFSDETRISKPTEYPYPCRLSSAQARIGQAQLLNLIRNLSHRRRIAGWLEQRIGWYGMSAEEVSESTWLRYSFLVRDRARFEALFAKRFELGIWFTSVVSGRTERLERVGYQSGSCPVAEHVVQHVVNFPTHLRIPLEMIQEEVERNWGLIGGDVLYGRAV